MIFWEARNPCPAEILPSADADWLQNMGNGARFSRLIGPVSKQYIQEH